MLFANNEGPGAYECIWSWWTNGFFDHLAPAMRTRMKPGFFEMI